MPGKAIKSRIAHGSTAKACPPDGLPYFCHNPVPECSYEDSFIPSAPPCPPHRRQSRRSGQGKQRGNALFLILIAVALFAALSYAVTTSGRGGGSVDKEQAVLLAAQITQFGSMVRTAATRIVLSGTSVENLQLCDSADADQFCSQGAGFCNDTSSNPGDCVFAAQGGGVPLQNIPEAAKASAGTQWLVMQENGPLPVVVQGVGTTAADIVMYTGIGITQSVCEAINKGLGLPVPVAADADFLANGLTAYDGEPFFCLLYTGHFYFHTIAER